MRPYAIAYGVTLTAFFALSFVVEGRVWGLNVWAWLPLWERLGLVAVGAIAALVAVRLRPVEAEPGKSGGVGYALIGGLIGVGLTAALVLLRQETHFLGDGYTLLQWLEDGGAINKMRNFGAQYTLRAVDRMLPGDSLVTFRIVAWGAGAIAMAAAAVGSALVFADTRRRVLLALGVLSGGYMLLFFGYVENYALFVLMVLLYCWTGVLAVRGRINPWWVLLPQAGAVFFHVFGVTLLPATVYLVLRETAVGRRLRRIDLRTRWLMAAGGAAAGVVVFGWFYTHSYFFRFAFVPVLPNRFTVNGYTMISLPHVADLLNLLFLLAPALLLFGVAKVRIGVRTILGEPLYRFLGLAALGALGAAFIFDPKLGMPRDWDLFSFGGAPLMMAGMLLVLDSPRRVPRGTAIAGLAVALGLLSLIPRAVVQHVPAMGIAQFEAYRELDPIQNRNGSIFVVDYYQRLGDSARAEELREEWHRAQKDEPLLLQGNAALEAGAYQQAVGFYNAALRDNPVYWVAYTNLGDAYLRMGKLDSSLIWFRIADGLNPSSPIILSNLGQAYYLNGQTGKGVAAWERAIALDPAFIQPRRFLVNHYRSIRDRAGYLAMLEEIATLDGAPGDNLAALADWYMQSNRLSEAGRLYERALGAGLDSAYVSQVIEKHPALRRELPTWNHNNSIEQ